MVPLCSKNTYLLAKMQRLRPIICPYICKIRAFFIDLEHPAGGNGPRGAGFAATCRHGITEWPRLSRRMRERPAPRLQAGNDATSDTLTTQDRCMKRRPDKLRRNGRKIDSRVSCTGGFARAHTHTGSAILPSVTDARLHSRGLYLRGGRERWGRWGETQPTTPGSGNRFAVRLASAAIRAALFPSLFAAGSRHN